MAALSAWRTKWLKEGLCEGTASGFYFVSFVLFPLALIFPGLIWSVLFLESFRVFHAAALRWWLGCNDLATTQHWGASVILHEATTRGWDFFTHGSWLPQRSALLRADTPGTVAYQAPAYVTDAGSACPNKPLTRCSRVLYQNGIIERCSWLETVKMGFQPFSGGALWLWAN